MSAVAVRIVKITSLAQLRGLGRHARRVTPTAWVRLREGVEPGLGLAWAKGDDPRDPVAAWRAHKASAAAQERKGAPLCLQALALVPDDWIREGGDLHDPDNPRNQALFGEARAWAEIWAGEGRAPSSPPGSISTRPAGRWRNCWSRRCATAAASR